MKFLPAYLALLIGSVLLVPTSHAIGDRRDRGGAATPKRSPMTGSKIERPAARPAPKPTPRPARPEMRPTTRPEMRPTARPEMRPTARPETRPAERPSVLRPETRPVQRPDTLPGKLPDRRPDTRPSMDRPGHTRPNTLPGMVTYPNRPDNRPNIGQNKINTGDRTNIHIDKVNVNRRNMGLNRPSTLPANRRDWDSNRWGGNHGVWGNNTNINININNNYSLNNNFSYRPNYWGASPWWGAGYCHTWHHGHWGYGWNNSYYRRHWYYYDNDFASGFMWGIAVWSMGNLIYDMGYQSYKNPYPAPPVQNTYITYTQPVSVAAAANPPGDEKAAELAETKSNEALERSRAAFRKGDYLAASKAVDEAIAHTPGDVTLHEYRALVFFALGKYSDAAGVLNPVLASGPGWGWDTMVGFYTSSGTYSDQLGKLEAYTKSAPGKADARFLLGYHYMVCDHMEQATAEFSKASELQPADNISRQLRDLTAASIPDAGAADAVPPARPAPVEPDQLVGTWVSDRGADGKINFTMTAAGDYTWAFINAGQSSQLKGTYGLDDKGLLVLTSDDTQMVSAVELKENKSLHFALVSAPDGDPGLDFSKE